MRKLITDFTKCPTGGENNDKSLICSQVEAGNVFADQLQCCFDGKCVSDLNDCLEYGDKYMAKCHNIATLDACRRTDALARQICGWKDSLFCLSTRSTSNVSDFSHLFEAIEWMLSRNRVEESYNNVTACLERTGNYQLCNTPAGTVNFGCNDFFDGGCNSCNWTGGDTKAPRHIKGELCEIIPTNTMTITTTAICSSHTLERGLTMGLGFPICLVLGLVAGILYYLKLRNKKGSRFYII